MVDVSQPVIHIGVVTYNSVQDLPACVDSIRAQTYHNWTLTILDNHSSDGSVDWLAKHVPESKLIIHSTNAGYGAGQNRILAECGLKSADFYLPLNPDVTLDPNCLSALIEPVREKNADWVAAKIMQSGEAARRANMLYSAGHAMSRDGYTVRIGHGLPDSERFSAAREVFGAPGAVCLITRRLIQRIAPDGILFDPDFFLYGEDSDLDWRARNQGLRCWYTPYAIAYHRGSQPDRRSLTLAIANRYLSVIKNAGWFDLLTYNLPIMIAHIALRLALTPEEGVFLLLRIARLSVRMLGRRRRLGAHPDSLRAWHSEVATEASDQPLSWVARFKRFWGNLAS